MLEVNISQYKSTWKLPAKWLPRFLLQHQRHEDQSSSCPIEVHMPVMLLASHNSLLAPQIRSLCSIHSDPTVDGNLFPLFLQKRKSRSCLLILALASASDIRHHAVAPEIKQLGGWAFPPRWKPSLFHLLQPSLNGDMVDVLSLEPRHLFHATHRWWEHSFCIHGKAQLQGFCLSSWANSFSSNGKKFKQRR